MSMRRALRRGRCRHWGDSTLLSARACACPRCAPERSASQMRDVSSCSGRPPRCWRREFTPRRGSLTAQQFVDRIRSSVGVPGETTTVDGIQGRRSGHDRHRSRDDRHGHDGRAAPRRGHPSESHRHAGAGVLFGHGRSRRPRDRSGLPREEETHRRQRLVVCRFSDHWSARQPSESAQALAATFGWKASPGSPAADQIYRSPETTLGRAHGAGTRQARHSRWHSRGGHGRTCACGRCS